MTGRRGRPSLYLSEKAMQLPPADRSPLSSARFTKAKFSLSQDKNASCLKSNVAP